MNEIKSLYKTYEDYFIMGIAVNHGAVETHKEIILPHFKSITSRAQMKLHYIHPEEDTYNFTDADTIVEFARANGKIMRGHTLMWEKSMLPWVLENADGTPASRDTVLGRYYDHMQTVMTRYKDAIWCWDVVNEAIFDDYDPAEKNLNGIIRKSNLSDAIGEDYVDWAFKTAEKINPNVKLIYNEYSEWYPGKSDRIFKMVKSMLDRGIKVDGLGLQGHWGISAPTPDDVRRIFDLYSKLGIPLQVTEMDLSVYNDFNRQRDPEFAELPAEVAERQAQLYADHFQIFREYKDILETVTFWSAADDTSWLNVWPREIPPRKNWPLLFDRDHQPKEAFFRVLNF